MRINAAIVGYALVGVPSDGSGNVTLTGPGTPLGSGKASPACLRLPALCGFEVCVQLVAGQGRCGAAPLPVSALPHSSLSSPLPCPLPSSSLLAPSPVEPVHLPAWLLSAGHPAHLLCLSHRAGWRGGAPKRAGVLQHAPQVGPGAPPACLALAGRHRPPRLAPARHALRATPPQGLSPWLRPQPPRHAHH